MGRCFLHTEPGERKRFPKYVNAVSCSPRRAARPSPPPRVGPRAHSRSTRAGGGWLTTLVAGEELDPAGVGDCPHLPPPARSQLSWGGGRGAGDGIALGHGPWGGCLWLEGEAEGSEGTGPPPELTDEGTEAQDGAMVCPRMDGGVVEPYLWVTHPPGLSIEASMHLALEGPTGMLRGPRARLHA